MGPLSISLNTAAVKNTIPLIANGLWVEFRLEEISGEHVVGKGDTSKWKWSLVTPTTSTEGKTLNVGFPFTENIQFYDKNTDPENPVVPEWALKKVCARIDGLLGTGDPENKKNKPVRPDFNAELVPSLIGKVIRVEMKVESSEQYGDKNQFGKIIFPGDIQA